MGKYDIDFDDPKFKDVISPEPFTKYSVFNVRQRRFIVFLWVTDQKWFSSSDYMGINPDISPYVASRDLKALVKRRTLKSNGKLRKARLYRKGFYI